MFGLIFRTSFFLLKELLMFIFYSIIVSFIVWIADTIIFLLFPIFKCHVQIFVNKIKLLYLYVVEWRTLPENSNFVFYKRIITQSWNKCCGVIKNYNLKTLSGWVNFIDNFFGFFLYHITIFLPSILFLYKIILPWMLYIKFLYEYQNYLLWLVFYMSWDGKDYTAFADWEFIQLNSVGLGLLMLFIEYYKLYLYSSEILFTTLLSVYCLKVANTYIFIEYIYRKYWYQTINTHWSLYVYRKTLKANSCKNSKFTLLFQKSLIQQLYLYANYLVYLIQARIVLFDFLIVFVKKVYTFIIYFASHETIKLFKMSVKFWFGGFFIFWRPLFKRLSYFGYYRTNQTKWFWYK